ncbi:MAG: tyrosine-type recombinase/integrase [Phocaeicola sp.]
MATLRTYQSSGYIGKDGKAPIYITFYLSKNKIVVPTKVSVKVEDFDTVSGKVKIGSKQHKEFNLIIQQARARINDIMVRYHLQKKELTKDLFLRDYNRPSDYKTFYVFFETYMKEHPHELENSTIDTHIDVVNKLKVYAPDLQLDEINEDFIEKYKGYLRKKLKNRDSTINKNMAVIKKYVRKALKAGYIDDDPFENIKISRKGSGRFTFLTEEELHVLIDLYKGETLGESYQSVLQFFLFLCFSSLHIGDAKTLRIEQIGQKTFTYYRIKNRNSKPEPIVVPLSKPLKSLIKNIIGLRRNGLIFTNLIADQKINEYIKKIASNVGIKKSLSTKSGRHTFATIFLKKTKDLATLKEIMGHSDYRETLIYAHVLEESKIEGIKSFNVFDM